MLDASVHLRSPISLTGFFPSLTLAACPSFTVVLASPTPQAPCFTALKRDSKPSLVTYCLILHAAVAVALPASPVTNALTTRHECSCNLTLHLPLSPLPARLPCHSRLATHEAFRPLVFASVPPAATTPSFIDFFPLGGDPKQLSRRK